MSTHPVEPEPSPSDPQPAAPNPSKLPVEPDFGQQLPPADPDEIGGKPPQP